MRQTATDYAHPYRPQLIRWANLVGEQLARLGIRARLDADSLVAAACRRERLRDFGDPDVDGPLKILCRSIEEEASLSPVGRLITRERMIGVLGNRLRAQKLFCDHPGILERETGLPILITGLQRTGTTLLHRLLAADPETRSLPSWEALSPAPRLPLRPDRPDPRRRLARISEWSTGYLAPDFFAIHPVQADAPEEDSLLLDFSLLSPVAEATLHVPGYSRWLRGQDMTPAYRYLEKLLKLLEWQRAPSSRWVLKSPAHLPFLDVIAAVLPRARVIHTHRDPAVTLASYCSMIAHGRGIFSDCIDPRALGQELLEQQSFMLLTGMALRDRPEHQGRLLDVYYDDLTRDPMAEVERIYAFLGLQLGAAGRSAMEASLKVNVQHRFGKHRYALDDFGLDPSEVRLAFAPYYERHRRVVARKKTKEVLSCPPATAQP